jgi:hypothetical protein
MNRSGPEGNTPVVDEAFMNPELMTGDGHILMATAITLEIGLSRTNF